MPHLSADCKSQEIQQYVVKDKKDQKQKKRHARSTVNMTLL